MAGVRVGGAGLRDAGRHRGLAWRLRRQQARGLHGGERAGAGDRDRQGTARERASPTRSSGEDGTEGGGSLEDTGRHRPARVRDRGHPHVENGSRFDEALLHGSSASSVPGRRPERCRQGAAGRQHEHRQRSGRCFRHRAPRRQLHDDIDFNVQPTDDGSKVFAETESGNNIVGFAAEVVASELLRASVEDAKRQQQQAVEEQNAAQSAALAEQQSANVASAKTDNQLAVQTIGATWQALPPATRSRLLPLQRAWIRKKDADCAVEAAGASVELTEKEMARLRCDTRVTQDRISWLGQYRDEESAAPDPSSPDTPGAMPQGGSPL